MEKKSNYLKLTSLDPELGFGGSPLQGKIELASRYTLDSSEICSLKCTSSLPEVSGQGVDSLRTDATSWHCIREGDCDDPAEASSSKARAQTRCKSAVSGAVESQSEWTEEEVLPCWPEEDRGITTLLSTFYVPDTISRALPTPTYVILAVILVVSIIIIIISIL